MPCRAPRSRCVLILMAAVLAGAVPARAAKPARPPAKGRKAKPPPAGPEEIARRVTLARLDRLNFAAVRLAVRDLAETFGPRYPRAAEFLRRADALEKQLPTVRRALADGQPGAIQRAQKLLAFQREALLANPLLDFERLLVIQRRVVGGARRPKGQDKGLGEFLGLPRQSSWQLDNLPNLTRWDNRLLAISPRGDREPVTVYQPPAGKLLSDVDLHWDAGKFLCSLPDAKGRLQVNEIVLGRSEARQLTPSTPDEIHNFDPCYLGDDRIVFVSTAPLQGVPCNASVNVAMTYRMDADGRNIRQLAFDQDHNYCPVPMGNGQLLYLRWEYTDLPHVWARFLFTMNPDGTVQREYYGSGGYWPNSIFYARPVPGHPTKVVGVVTGHHVGRVGELVVFDPARGRRTTEGVVQRIPGAGRTVLPRIQDKLTENSWPKFLHPWPLSEKYILVSAKPTPADLWGIYLVDTFDNMVLVQEMEDWALLEPIPIVRRPRPPLPAPRSNDDLRDAVVYIEDIYTGRGLAGVPRGAVKQLRLFTYHFVYQKMAGINHHVGVDGPWEPKRVLGTVPVEADGSALFRIPAKTPIAIQPLAADGSALQLMRSWTTAMPGEIVSCTGCHEKQNDAPPNRRKLATRKDPVEIAPWHGPVRGFSFVREVQPVLDKYCVSCHDGSTALATGGSPRADGKAPPNLRRDQDHCVVFRNSDPQPRTARRSVGTELFRRYSGIYPPAFVELRKFVRVGGYESDIRLLAPREFAGNTCELVQMLRKGHHGVTLDADAWERLFTWIDLNAPCHGTWREAAGPARIAPYHPRRRELRKLYAGLDDDPESYPQLTYAPPEPVQPERESIANRPSTVVNPKGWPLTPARARQRQADLGDAEKTLDLGGGATLKLVRIPAGQFVMGDAHGHPDERPRSVVRVDKPFWLGRCEITNAQFARFDPSHDSRFEHKGSWSFSERHIGWPLNAPQQPVVRVSWKEAMAFCAWLGRKTGLAVTLPTEAQWEYACRAGSDSPFSYGGLDTDFAPFANLSDATMRQLAYDTDGRYTADLTPRDARFNDGMLVTAPVGRYRPNAWGACDMHGNVWEWTLSARRPYPYKADDGRNALDATGERIVRGGSWRDRPQRARSAFRLSYPAWQKVYNVGFRVVVRAE